MPKPPLHRTKKDGGDHTRSPPSLNRPLGLVADGVLGARRLHLAPRDADTVDEVMHLLRRRRGHHADEIGDEEGNRNAEQTAGDVLNPEPARRPEELGGEKDVDEDAIAGYNSGTK